MVNKMESFSNEAYYLFFSALASRTRLAIIDSLIDGPKSVSEISTTLEQDQSVTSEHLKRLEKSYLVLSEAAGKERRYSLNREVIEPLSEILDFHTNKYCPRLKECIPTKKLREYMKKEASKETYIKRV